MAGEVDEEQVEEGFTLKLTYVQLDVCPARVPIDG
jgi:hypothetical protein